MMVIDNKYNIKDTVYLTTDTEQLPRLVTGIVVTEGELMYELSNSLTISKHYAFEISRDKNILVE